MRFAPIQGYHKPYPQTPDGVPVIMVEPDGIHDELKGYDHYVVWVAVPREEGDGFDKVPYDARTGRKASTTDSRTWSSFDEAVAAYVRDGWDGIGFVISSGDPFTFIDLDNCRSETGDIAEWAQEWIDRFNGYTEISPSGTGIHIIVRGKSAHNGKRMVEGKKAEIYSERRFATLTGVRP